jgi:hypothetical protein
MKVNHNSNPQVTLYNFNFTTNAKERIPEADDAFLYAEPVEQQQYFDVRAPFNPVKILKSPMGMMIGMTVLMMWCMKNMPDAEELRKEQAAARQSNSQQAATR